METRIRQHPERSVTEEAPVIFSEGLVAHVGFCEGGQPFVIPMTYHYDPADPKNLYLHGSPASRAMRILSEGVPVCVTVTTLQGLVYSRDAKYHSMNYRSAMCFGKAYRVEDSEKKQTVFRSMISRYFAGRTEGHDYAAATAAQLAATELVCIEIEAWSAKEREGGPRGPRDADPEAPGTCGVDSLQNRNA